MTTWMGWTAAQPSRLTWDEWREQQRGAANVATITTTVGDHSDTLAVPESRIARLEQLCGQLTVENAGLRTALAHWQRQPQPVAVGA